MRGSEGSQRRILQSPPKRKMIRGRKERRMEERGKEGMREGERGKGGMKGKERGIGGRMNNWCENIGSEWKEMINNRR